MVSRRELLRIFRKIAVDASCLCKSRGFLIGRAEYDRDTLRSEYMRDLATGADIQSPKNYFPGDDPGRKPAVTWYFCSHLHYSNWLNYFAYQNLPLRHPGHRKGHPHQHLRPIIQRPIRKPKRPEKLDNIYVKTDSGNRCRQALKFVKQKGLLDGEAQI